MSVAKSRWRGQAGASEEHDPSGFDSTSQNGERRGGSLILGVISAVLSVVYTVQALDMPTGTLASPGPGAWPVAVGVGWILISVVVLFEAFRTQEIDKADFLPRGSKLIQVVIFASLTIGYVVLIPLLGIYICSVLFAVGVLKTLSASSWAKCLISGGIIGTAISLVFVEVLQVRLPLGLLG